MSFLKNRWQAIAISLYLTSVVACIFFAFDFAGAIDAKWTMALIGLTLPWSLVSFIFAWALIHGAGLEMFAMMYLFFAVVNSLLFYFAFRKSPLGLEHTSSNPNAE